MHSLEQWRFINLDVHRARCFQGNFSYQSSSLILSEFLVGLQFLTSVYITDPEKSLKLIQCYHCSNKASLALPKMASLLIGGLHKNNGLIDCMYA